MIKKPDVTVRVLTKLDKLLDRQMNGGTGGADFKRHTACFWDGRRRALEPVKRPVSISPDELIGIETAKEEVLRNTKSFLDGKRANNVLLWGERGTGKSSLVKSLLTAFAGTKLRMIQVYKHDVLTVRDMYDLIAAGKSYRFILFIDDLSFEERQADYQEMKTIMDGGLEEIPENLLFYATSNRKHLVPTRFSDQDPDEIRPSDTVEEKVSLVDRFGLRLGFYHVSQEAYLEIAASYARKYGIRMAREALDRLAIQWALRSGARNGRTAEQFARAVLDGVIG